MNPTARGAARRVYIRNFVFPNLDILLPFSIGVNHRWFLYDQTRLGSSGILPPISILLAYMAYRAYQQDPASIVRTFLKKTQSPKACQ